MRYTVSWSNAGSLVLPVHPVDQQVPADLGRVSDASDVVQETLHDLDISNTYRDQREFTRPRRAVAIRTRRVAVPRSGDDRVRCDRSRVPTRPFQWS